MEVEVLVPGRLLSKDFADTLAEDLGIEVGTIYLEHRNADDNIYTRGTYFFLVDEETAAVLILKGMVAPVEKSSSDRKQVTLTMLKDSETGYYYAPYVPIIKNMGKI